MTDLKTRKNFWPSKTLSFFFIALLHSLFSYQLPTATTRTMKFAKMVTISSGLQNITLKIENKTSDCLLGGNNSSNGGILKDDEPKCFFGFEKSLVMNLYIRFEIPSQYKLSAKLGFVLQTYSGNQNKSIPKFKRLTFEYNGSNNRLIRKQLCQPTYEDKDIHVVDNVTSRKLKMSITGLQYWNSLRQVVIITKENIDKSIKWHELSEGSCLKQHTMPGKQNRIMDMASKSTSAPIRSEAELSNDTIFAIRLSASLSVIGVFILFTMIWCCLKKNNIVIEIPLKSKKYFSDEENKPKTSTNEATSKSVDTPLIKNLKSKQRSGLTRQSNGYSQDYCICKACLINNTNRSLREKPGILKNSSDSPRRKIYTDRLELQKIQQNFENDSDDSLLGSPQHRYLDLPASIEEDNPIIISNRKLKMKHDGECHGDVEMQLDDKLLKVPANIIETKRPEIEIDIETNKL